MILIIIKKLLAKLKIVSEIEKVEEKYKGNGRVFIRASGTEPLVRVMIEKKKKKEITQDAEKLAKLIEKILN